MTLEDRLKGLVLPPGQVVGDDEGEPVLWLSEGPASPELWQRIAREEPGLWPLVLGDDGPWDSDELVGCELGERDAAVLLPKWWHENVNDDEDDETTAPFGRDWPGFAPALPLRGEPDGVAFRLVESMLGKGAMRLGVVAAEQSADAIAASGWSGATNYISDETEVVAVVRDWEKRFGTRVVGLGYDRLYLSVAAPPRSQEEALLVAAEHFAFCPDNVWQDLEAPTLAGYAQRLVGRGAWTFWWD